MLLRETGFTFNGIHSRNDMGMLYAEKDGHMIIPKIKRNAYQIAGVSGTVLMDGETYDTITFDGTLYPAVERPTQAQAQEMLRNVAAWLTAGRCRLIFDYEPNLYYEAELSAGSKWSLKNWFGGELPITFEAQPFAYAVNMTTKTVTMNATTVTLTVNLQTGQPAPLRLEVRNTGTAVITGVRIGDAVVMSQMSLTAGQVLSIDMDPPIGARIGSVNALPYASAFAPINLVNGSNSINVQLTYGSGSKGAQVTAGARGRW